MDEKLIGFILDKEAGYDEAYYLAYGIGTYMRQFSIDRINGIKNQMDNHNFKIDSIKFSEFKDWFLDGWNILSDALGDRMGYDEIYFTAQYVGYLLYCNKKVYSKLEEIYLDSMI